MATVLGPGNTPGVLPSIDVPDTQQPAPQDTGVSLSTPAQDPDTGVSLSSPTQAPQVPPVIAAERAKKMQEGVGEHLQKTTEEIQQEIQAGREDVLRNQASSAMDLNNNRRKQQMLVDLANQKGGPLDEDEAAKIMDPFNPLNKPVDPKSVVETQYATKYIASIQDAIGAIPNNPVDDAQKEMPEEVDQTYLKGSVLAAKMEFAKKIREDLETQISQQSYVGYGVDQLKQMFQPYNEYKLRGNVEGVGGISGGLGLGENLEAQGDRVFSLPFDQFTKVLTNVSQGLAKDNPSLAHRFVSYVEGLPATDRILDNTFTAIAPFDYASMGKAGLGLARKVSLYNRTNIAVKQLVKAADKVGTDAAARSEAAGDLGTAAETKATGIILQNINGQSDAIKIATDDTLLTMLNQDKDKVATSPGNLTGQQVTKIVDAYDASGQTLIQRIVDAARINRIPMALATRNAVSIIKDTVKDWYPGIRNAILDVSDPLYEPRSNTYWHEVTLGNFDGTLFGNPNTAKNFAKIHGLDDVQIVEGQGVITPPQISKMYEDKAALEKNITDWEQTVIRRKAEAGDAKATPQDRAKAKEQAEGIQEQIKIAQKKVDDYGLRLKGNETYDRVQHLQSEIDQHRLNIKNTRDELKKNKQPTDEQRVAAQGVLDFSKAQVIEKAKEINAIKQGNASVIRPVDTIQQHGVGFKIVVRRPLVETDKAVRDLMIRDASGKLIPEATSTASQTGFKSLMNAAIGKFRGADDTLALNESINRKIGTYTQSLFKEWAYQEAKYIKQVASGVIRTDPVTGETIPYWRAKAGAVVDKVTGRTHKTYNEFVRALDFARDDLDPITGKPGYFKQTPGELQNHYQMFYGRDPTFAEHEGYFAFVRMVEGDRIMREISEFRNRARLGTEQFSISARGPDGKRVKSNFFDGVAKKVFPGGDDVMLITSQKLGEEKVINLGGAAIAPRKLEEYKEAVRTGKLRVIEVYAPEYKPLRDFSDVAGNEHIRYVLTDAADSKPIEFNHVNRRGGGHFEYDYDHFLKQASMYHQYETGTKGRYKSVYTGDTTFMPVLNRVMGRDIANKLHTIQKLIRDGDLEEARRFTEAHLPIEWNKLHGMFKPGRDANGKITPPSLDLNEPFVVVPNGLSVIDMDKGLEGRYGKYFKDSAKSGSLNKQFQVAYNTERESSGLTHLDDIGTQGNPLYKYAPTGKMIDPITTMNRSLNRIVSSTFMDDYKMYAVEHWLREAETHLKADITEIRASPFWHFNQATDKSAFKAGTPRDTISNLLSNRYKIQQFVGVPNKVDTAIQTATQWLVDTAYEKYGPEASRGLGTRLLVNTSVTALASIKDPVKWMRNMTFHFKLGLFNPAQMLVQAQTYANILAISPIHGTSGTFATLLHQWSRINPSMIPALDRVASKMGWKPGEWTEAKRLLDSTGFEKVAGEYANLDSMKTDFVGNDLKSIANAGTWFFTEGEKSTRLGAWYTAYKEFRSVNPTGPVSKADLGTILQRADLFTANMSRASNSAMNSGVFSMTTQFLNFTIRQAELFMGGRLTGIEKLRLATFYSLLYGAPSAIGLTGLPMTNAIRQEAMQRGYQVGDNWYSTAIDQGLPSMFLAWITGKGDWQKGNLYNIGDRYGSQGFTQLVSDKPWYQLLAGASGTTLLNTLTSTNSFFHAVAAMAFRPNGEKPFPMKLDDFIDIFKEISSVNQSWKLIAAINTGKWMSKNESYIGDVTKANAAFMATLGLSPQQQDDAYLKGNIKTAEIEYQKYTMKTFIEEYRRGLQAAADKNPQQAAQYMQRAFTMLEVAGFPADKKATAIAVANKGYESRIKTEDWDFAFKNVPQSRSDFMGIPTPFTTQSNIPRVRQDQFRRTQQLNQMQGQ